MVSGHSLKLLEGDSLCCSMSIYLPTPVWADQGILGAGVMYGLPITHGSQNSPDRSPGPVKTF